MYLFLSTLLSLFRHLRVSLYKTQNSTTEFHNKTSYLKHYYDARSSWRQAVEALRLVQEAKRAKHAETCLAHGFDFAPFTFSVLGSFCPVAEEILTRFCKRYVSHAHIRPWEAHQWVYRHLSFTIMRGVAEQFVRRLSSDFG